MTDHTIGTRTDWLAARDRLLVREKEHTRLGDELARERRELPWVRVEKDERFDTDDGERSGTVSCAGSSTASPTPGSATTSTPSSSCVRTTPAWRCRRGPVASHFPDRTVTT